MRGIRVLRSNEERDPRETLDVFVGAVGFFAFALFVITLVCELTGADALGWALALLALVLLLGLLLSYRHRLTTRMLARRGIAHADAVASLDLVAHDEKTDTIRR